MSFTSAPQPDSAGSSSQENAPLIIARAEKYFVCAPCGTLVEIPADVAGRLVYAAVSKQPETTSDEPIAEPTKSEPVARRKQPSNPLRRPSIERVSYANRQVDGLRVPSGKQLHRAFSWVTFHLKVLDRQESEIKRLKKLLKRASVPCPQPREKTKSYATHLTPARPCGAKREHAQEDLGVAPDSSLPDASEAQERGPPD